jgi:hypothetical protein
MASPELMKAVDHALEVYEDLIGEYAGRTRPMLERYGYVGALSKLVQTADTQIGFKKLRDRGLMDISFETVVIRFQGEFDRHAIAAARWRLDHPDELL